jgi:hypothetical protein
LHRASWIVPSGVRGVTRWEIALKDFLPFDAKVVD